MVDIDKISAIDLTGLSAFITDDEARGFFLLQEGREHYKLLSYLSTLQDGIIISDIGTYKGCSALALAYNPNNHVFSYDISDQRKLNVYPDNIDFIVYNKAFSRNILQSKIIVLDIMHDGIEEKIIIDFLKDNNWKGTLIMDDIHHFPDLNKLWNNLTLDKEDVTNIGHWSGTGIINF